MSVPKQVRDAAKAADAQFIGQAAPQATPPVDQPTPAPEQHPATQAPAETKQEAQASQQAVAPTPPPSAPRATRVDELLEGIDGITDPAELRSRLATVGQSLRTLRGKYGAEVPGYAQRAREAAQEAQELRAAFEQLQAKVSEYEAELSRLRAAPPPQAAPAAAPARPEEVFGQELVDMLGNEGAQKLLAGFERRVAAAIQAESAKVRPAVDQSAQLAAKQATMAAQRVYEGHLMQLVPDCLQLNTDPGFNEWLNAPDGFSGRPRRESLNAAHSNMDAARVAAVFNAYKQERELGIDVPLAPPQQQVLPGGRPTAPSAVPPPVARPQPMTIEQYQTEHEALMRRRMRGQNITKEIQELDARWQQSRRQPVMA